MASPIRTGFESVLPHLVDSKFAYAAKGTGKIKEKGAKYVVITYDDKNLDDEQLTIGLTIASSKGNYYPHDIVCDLPVGHKFKKGDILVFNRSFFTRDVLEPTQVIICDKVFARTMLLETNDTFEDSSAISSDIAGALETRNIKQRTIVVDHTDVIKNLVNVGDYVEVDSELAFIDNQVFEGKTHFGGDSLDILKRLSKSAPKAQIKGKVVKIECFYFCEEDELSPSLKELVSRINRELYSGTKAKASDRRDMNGKIIEPLKFGGTMVGPGNVAIRVYIEGKVGTAGGDKVVFASQLKSVVTRAYQEKHYTESGKEVHAMFGYQSVSARMVASPELMGTTYALLKLITIDALKAYDG